MRAAGHRSSRRRFLPGCTGPGNAGAGRSRAGEGSHPGSGCGRSRSLGCTGCRDQTWWMKEARMRMDEGMNDDEEGILWMRGR